MRRLPTLLTVAVAFALAGCAPTLHVLDRDAHRRDHHLPPPAANVAPPQRDADRVAATASPAPKVDFAAPRVSSMPPRAEPRGAADRGAR